MKKRFLPIGTTNTVQDVLHNHRVLLEYIEENREQNIETDVVRYLIANYGVHTETEYVRVKGEHEDSITIVEVEGKNYKLKWEYNHPDTWRDCVYPAQKLVPVTAVDEVKQVTVRKWI